MAISSVSRVFDAPDPIMETDLDLLAKVNEYQQTKFDVNGEAIQQEINNWSMLADVAKPQDKEYINAKLNNLIQGINSLGAVNLADTNNVNAIKGLGYNIYGDNKIINAVSTTRKLRGYMSDGQAKLNGKQGKNYDPTLYDYNLDKWNAWINDGQVGTAFNGPTQLAQGNFDQYQKKISDELTKLQPDMDSMPVGMSDAEKLNYLQVGNKFITKDRVRQAIDALTNANDKEIISAHAWRNLSGLPDIKLVGMTTDGYNSKISQMQDQYNKIKHDKNLTQDFSQAERYQQQLDELDGSLKGLTQQRNQLLTDTAGGVNDDTRKALRDNIYFDAYKTEIANSRAYTQNKTELKFNQAQAVKIREARGAYEFALTHDLAERRLEFDKEKESDQLSLKSMSSLYGSTPGQLNANGIQGPASLAPLQIIPVKGDDANVLNGDVVKNADANFIAQSQKFYAESYNYLANIPDYQNYLVKAPDGNYVPKDNNSRIILETALNSKIGQLEKIANIPATERKGLTINDKDNNLLNLSQTLQDSKLYQEQVRSLQNDVYKSVGLENPKDIYSKIEFKDGSHVSVSYEKLKQMIDSKDPLLDEWQQRSASRKANSPYGIGEDIVRSIGSSFAESALRNPELAGKINNTSLYNAMRKVYSYYDDPKMQDKWKEVSQTLNPYGRNIALPKIKGQGVPSELTKYFADKVREVKPSAAINQADVDLNKIWVKLNPGSENKVQYLAEVKYKKGGSSEKSTGDQLATVDLTTDVLNNPNGFIAKLYPQDNAQIIYGFMMDKDGKTPFNASNNYADALKTTSNPQWSHKYQIVSNKNNQNGLESFSVNLLVPRRVGNDIKYFTMPVKNIDAGGTSTFPPNYQYVTRYMNDAFQNEKSASEFYQLHKIPVPSTSSATAPAQ